jgi:hypothetical protein
LAARNPLSALAAARTRRAGFAAKEVVRIEWFIKQTSDKIRLTLRQRVRLATALLKNKVVLNISIPVTKHKGPRGGTIVTNRSKPGEFPRADTVQLMRTIMSGTGGDRKSSWGFVGTPLDYGLLLETKMNRSFLVRTLNEERGNIVRILTGPIK